MNAIPPAVPLAAGMRAWLKPLVLIVISVAGSTASAQFFGPFGRGYGYGPPIAIAVPAPGYLAPPVVGWGGPAGIMAGLPPYPHPFAYSSRYIARRHAMMEHFALVGGYPYPYPAAYMSLYAPPPRLDAPYLEGPYLQGPYAIAAELDIFLERPVLNAAPPLPPVLPYPGVIDPSDRYLEHLLEDEAYPTEPREDFALPEMPSESGAFAASASRLSRELSRHENGEMWIDFLQPDQLAAMAADGLLPSGLELRDLAARYQGVLANPDLAWLRRVGGFEDTRAGLLAITGMPDNDDLDRSRSEEAESVTNEPEVMILPLPAPEPDPRPTISL